jgi:hypothetical protein
MHDSVRDEGVALFNSLPHENHEFNSWATHILGELVPHEYSDGYVNLFGGFRISISEVDLPPVFTPFGNLGLEKYVGPRLGQIHPRLGSTEWAKVVPHNTPFYVSWEVGDVRARVSVVANDLDEPWWGSTYRGDPSANPYGGDLFLNMVYWSVGMEPITNIAIVHSVRVSYGDYLLRRAVTLSLVEFIDAFGASVGELEEDLNIVTEGRAEVRALYFEQRYEEAVTILDEMEGKMIEIEARAIELKERAFLWIYLIEWLAVTGTLLVVGFATWTLMVRRRLYREVSVTRSSG